MRLLIVRLSSLGDVVHTLPIAANARRSGARVFWVVEAAYSDLLESNPNVDRVVIADTKQWRRRLLSRSTSSEISSLVRELRDLTPDATIDAQGLWKSALIARSAGAPVIGFSAGDRKEPSSAVLCDRPVRPLSGGHVVDRNLALAEAAGIPVADRSPDARFLLGRPTPEADAFLAEQPRPFALYHPGARRSEKTWGEERFAALAALLSSTGGLAPVLSWGPGDEKRVRRLSGLLPLARILPPLTLPGLARVVAKTSLFVAGDTGPLHLADALRVPTLALFGPTDPARNGPYRRPGSAVRYDAKTGAEEVARKALEVIAA
ncbi:MAG TPA: lipopolysaccharide heptosyltransferase I [Thermoanaerobaculia bacterium]|jgi:lipopolysaccharide heptosyltransferase I|nr:lipopolysaccharide heptosyltransferase I [Thermoanaerobaculia bacterium]